MVKFREKDLWFENKCPVCDTISRISVNRKCYGTTDCMCGSVTYPTGSVIINGTDEEVLNDMQHIVDFNILTNSSDFRVDRTRLDAYAGPFLWAYRKQGGCDLVLLDLPHKRQDHEANGLFREDNEHFYFYGTYFREVPRSEAEIIWRAECT